MKFSELTRDIIEQLPGDRTFAEGEDPFRTFMNYLPGYAWIKDAEGRYLFINDPLQGILGKYRNDWRGRLDAEFWPENADEYRKNDLKVLEEKRALQTIETWLNERQVRTFLVNKFPIFAGDNRTLVGGVSIDITELRRAEDGRDRAEQKFREIFENAGEGIFQSTPEGQYIAANPALARMYGYDSPEELIAGCRDISQQIYADPARREEFKRLLDTAGIVRNFETRTLRRNGSRLWISVNARAVRDANGEILYYEGTSRDITERKRAEKKSIAFATLARKLSGALTQVDAGSIIAQTAKDLFGWDACNLDLYDASTDVVTPLLNIDTIDEREVNVTPLIGSSPPTVRSRRVIEGGPELLLRDVPVKFDPDAIPFGDTGRASASLMTVPIKNGVNVIGLLSIQSYTPHAYDQEALKDFGSLAEHCAEAINRIHAEQLLRESQERFRQLADHLEDVIWVADRGLTQLLYINSAYERVFGRSCESVYGRLMSFLDAVHPEDREMVSKKIEAQRQGDYRAFEYRIVRPDGSIRWMLRRAFPIRDEHGEVYRIAGIGQDITARINAQEKLRESERRYRDLFENSRDAIYLHDMNGRYLSVNGAAEELSGYSRNEILGRNFADFVSSDFMAKIRKNFCKKLSNLGATMYEIEIINKDGEAVPVEVSSRMIYKEGVPIGVQGTIRDISERKHTQKILRGYSRRLVEAQEMERKKIARELHDEIGQILTAVRISLQSIQRNGDSLAVSRIEESVTVIDEALERVRELSLELRPALLDDLGLATALRWYVKRYCERSGIKGKVVSDFDDDFRLPRKLETACFRITQEALTNVARHAEAARVRIVLNLSKDEFGLSIIDDGKGFDAAALFTKASSESFGLHGIEERAFDVGGTLEIESAPGRGTHLRLRFPLPQKSAATYNPPRSRELHPVMS
jgi:PAS domain S-box-containing protein